MKIFIDSGNLKEIEALVPLGIIDGVTTNPSLMAKEGGDYTRDPQEDLRASSKGPVSAEVVATDADGDDPRGARARRRSTSTSSSRCRSRATASRRARRSRAKACRSTSR